MQVNAVQAGRRAGGLATAVEQTKPRLLGASLPLAPRTCDWEVGAAALAHPLDCVLHLLRPAGEHLRQQGKERAPQMLAGAQWAPLVSLCWVSLVPGARPPTRRQRFPGDASPPMMLSQSPGGSLADSSVRRATNTVAGGTQPVAAARSSVSTAESTAGGAAALLLLVLLPAATGERRSRGCLQGCGCSAGRVLEGAAAAGGDGGTGGRVLFPTRQRASPGGAVLHQTCGWGAMPGAPLARAQCEGAAPQQRLAQGPCRQHLRRTTCS